MNTTIKGVEFAACLCGCGSPVSAKSNYKPGHDARHAGQVARDAAKAYIDGTDTDWIGVIHNAPLASDALRSKAIRIAEGILDGGRASAKASEKVKETEKAPEYTEISTVKVGRWSYPARMTQAGKLERNEKRDGSGVWIPVSA